MSKIHALSTSVLVSRAELASKLGLQYGGERDLYEALGYPTTLTYTDMMVRYLRQDIAAAIINKPVDTTWRGGFKIIESTKKEDTAFEKAWKELDERLKLLPKFVRVDKLVGLGNYGVLLLGFDDVATREDFAEPVKSGKRKLLYVKPFGQNSAKISKWEDRPTNERYGLPLLYDVQITNPGSGSTTQLLVHYSRVVHITDNLLESEAEGRSRLEVVFNRLADIEKLVGGSAEMFWRGARPGYQGKVGENYSLGAEAKAALQEQLDEYEHNLRRFLINEGIDIQSLAAQIEDPGAHLDVQLQLISAVTGMPKRILTGSERGELASSQDAESWFGQITERRTAYAEPNIVRPFIQRLVETGVLPQHSKEGYDIEWVSLFDVSDQEKVNVGKSRAEALSQYVSNPDAATYVPMEAFLKLFLGLDEEDVEYITELQDKAMLEELKYREPEEEDDDKEDTSQDSPATHGGPGSGHWGHAGRPGKRGGSVSGDKAVSITSGRTAKERQAAAKSEGKDTNIGRLGLPASAPGLDSSLTHDTSSITTFRDITEPMLEEWRKKRKDLGSVPDGVALKMNVQDALVKYAKDPDVHAYLEGSFGVTYYNSKLTHLNAGEQIKDFIRKWAHTSADEDLGSLFLQKMAKEEFGLGDAIEDHFEKSIYGHFEHTEQMQRGAKKLLRAMYEHTQARLKAEGITEVLAYRGQRLRIAEMSKEMDVTTSAPQKLGVQLQPMSSFSASNVTAFDFAVSHPSTLKKAQVVMAAKVPASRIISTPGTGFGCHHEYEYVVLGGEADVLCRVVHQKKVTIKEEDKI